MAPDPYTAALRYWLARGMTYTRAKALAGKGIGQ